ncbi:uncharacterized protein LOC117084927 [Trachypithecus francoisi]|uniref:uncharacterized protein LOC117084927 n=1 Tax=Trachypithecus francoisi TaxID=54180 RepID=UPI00141B2DEF|nr:uncharacterized protein LOC117084927 [Trachypithecus francoisi]
MPGTCISVQCLALKHHLHKGIPFNTNFDITQVSLGYGTCFLPTSGNLMLFSKSVTQICGKKNNSHTCRQRPRKRKKKLLRVQRSNRIAQDRKLRQPAARRRVRILVVRKPTHLSDLGGDAGNRHVVLQATCRPSVGGVAHWLSLSKPRRNLLGISVETNANDKPQRAEAVLPLLISLPYSWLCMLMETAFEASLLKEREKSKKAGED